MRAARGRARSCRDAMHDRVILSPRDFRSGVVSTFALAWNHNTGVLVQRSGYGSSSSVSTGDVYSGPAFSHNLDASSTVEGEGDCVGYLSIDDHLN